MPSTELLNFYATETASTLDGFLDSASTVSDWLFGQAVTVVNTIIANPLLSVGALSGLIFTGIGVYHALKH